MKKKLSCLDDLLHFLDNSPTAWHAVEEISARLNQAGFEELQEGEVWKIKPGKAYFVKRNGATLGAFIAPAEPPTSLMILGAHTDSPAFKLKPKAEFIKENMLMLGVEIYGGPLLTSWLNRDLGIAGRVIYRDRHKNIHEELITLDTHPVVIPQLAIHLDRNVNESGLTLNKQEHLAAIAALVDPKKTKAEGFLEGLIREKIGQQTILGHDLFLYPIEKARQIGYGGELISSYRIDNLGGAHAILEGILAAKKPANMLKMALFWNHEEIGSNTAQGAGSPFLPHLLERVIGNREDYLRLINKGLCVSVDLTHALHPNYGDKHEPRHPVLMSHGIVIKTNAQHRYASDAKSIAPIVGVCLDHQIPFQHFVSRNDIPSGTTIGPIAAHLMGIDTVDIGYAQLSMHSCREIASGKDHEALVKLLKALMV